MLSSTKTVVLCVMLLISQVSAVSAEDKDLLGSLAATAEDKDLGSLAAEFQEEQSKLTALLNPMVASMGTIDDTASQAATLNTLTTATKILLQAAGFLPYVGPAFKAAGRTVDKVISAPLGKLKTALKQAKSKVSSPFQKSVGTYLDKCEAALAKLQTHADQVKQARLILAPQSLFVRELVCTAVPGSKETMEAVEKAAEAAEESLRNVIASTKAMVQELSNKNSGLNKFFKEMGKVGKIVNDVMKPLNALKPISDLMTKKVKIPVFGNLYSRKTIEAKECPSGYGWTAARCYENCPSGFEGKTLDRCWSKCKNKGDDFALHCNTPIKNNRDFAWNMNNWKKSKKKKWKREDRTGFYKKCDVQFGNGFHDGNWGPPRFCYKHCDYQMEKHSGFDKHLRKCKKKAIKRISKTPTCKSGYQKQGLLCYKKCNDGEQNSGAYECYKPKYETWSLEKLAKQFDSLKKSIENIPGVKVRVRPLIMPLCFYFFTFLIFSHFRFFFPLNEF